MLNRYLTNTYQYLHDYSDPLLKLNSILIDSYVSKFSAYIVKAIFNWS